MFLFFPFVFRLARGQMHHHNHLQNKLIHVTLQMRPQNLSSSLLLSYGLQMCACSRPDVGIRGHPSSLGSCRFMASSEHLLCHQWQRGSSDREAWLSLSCSSLFLAHRWSQVLEPNWSSKSKIYIVWKNWEIQESGNFWLTEGTFPLRPTWSFSQWCQVFTQKVHVSS